MKRVVIALLLMAGLAAPAMAADIKVTSGAYQVGTGGEFTFEVLTQDWAGLDAGDTFQTFCIERNEYLSFGSSYDAYTSPYAEKGGISGQTEADKDPISVGTAYLYSEFAAGTLAGYDFTTLAGRRDSAAALQVALWFLEGEYGTTKPTDNIFVNAVYAMFADPTAGNNGQFNVAAVNLTSSRGTVHHQSALMVPPPPTVPDGGATLMLLGGALLGIGALRRGLGR